MTTWTPQDGGGSLDGGGGPCGAAVARHLSGTAAVAPASRRRAGIALPAPQGRRTARRAARDGCVVVVCIVATLAIAAHSRCAHLAMTKLACHQNAGVRRGSGELQNSRAFCPAAWKSNDGTGTWPKTARAPRGARKNQRAQHNYTTYHSIDINTVLLLSHLQRPTWCVLACASIFHACRLPPFQYALTALRPCGRALRPFR